MALGSSGVLTGIWTVVDTIGGEKRT
ncbi:MAG: hypothetical protein RIR11_4673, partial [Bacteroidota bacterium]